MSVTTPPSDPELAAEQAYLDRRPHVAGRHAAAGRAAPARTSSQPAIPTWTTWPRSPGGSRSWPTARDPSSSGASTRRTGPRWHIGRRHVEDARSDPVVIDWRAPVAVPFYRASAKDPLGLARRRQIMVDRGAVVAVADDLFGGGGDEAHDPAAGRRRPAGRARAGPDRRDARHRRHHSGRAGRDHPGPARPSSSPCRAARARARRRSGCTVPPSSSTTTRALSRDGVLVLGPSRAFLRYIAQVLPVARRGGRRPDDDRRHRPQGQGPAQGADGGAAPQGRPPHGRAPAPCPRGAPAAARRRRHPARPLRSGDR